MILFKGLTMLLLMGRLESFLSNANPASVAASIHHLPFKNLTLVCA
jgi:hypothetical protein